MIIGSLSTLAVNRQDIGGVVSQASDGQAASTAAKAGAASTADAAGSAAGVSYVSPFGRYDYSSHMEILQFRNAETGKVTLQIPSERVVDAYRRGAAVSAVPQAAHSAATAQLRQAVANQDAGNQTAAAAGRTFGTGTDATGTGGSTSTTGISAPNPAPAPPVVAPDTGIAAAAAPSPAPAPVPTPAPAPTVETKPAASSGTTSAA